jgi:BlaI family transcriptional regulator, penicillinase repressor
MKTQQMSDDSKPIRLGKVQLEIMMVLWTKGEATARDITDTLSSQKPVAHSTVQTLLRDLEAKGAITHESQERTFAFKPLVRREDVLASSVRDLVQRVFQGSAYDLVAQLLKEEKVSEGELMRLKSLIEKHQKETDK